MRIGGLQKISFIDYPQKTAAIIFTQGCNFRCGYCHNPELIYPQLYQIPIFEEEVFAFLETRKGKLDGVVITGGEPTLQPDLISFMEKVKDMGFLIKLDSNGSNPDVLKKVIDMKLVDYIAMDIKAPFDKYNLVCGVNVNLDNIKKSIELIKNSGIDFQFRTTYDKTKLVDNDIQTMTTFLDVNTHYKVQQCNEVKLPEGFEKQLEIRN